MSEAASSAGDKAEDTETAPSTTEGSEKATEKGKEPAPSAKDADEKPASTELPTDVKAKLRRLDKLESRYHGM